MAGEGRCLSSGPCTPPYAIRPTCSSPSPSGSSRTSWPPPFVLAMVVLSCSIGSQAEALLYAVLGGGMMGMWGNTLYASDSPYGRIAGGGPWMPIFAAPQPPHLDHRGEDHLERLHRYRQRAVRAGGGHTGVRHAYRCTTFPCSCCFCFPDLLATAAWACCSAAAPVLTRSAEDPRPTAWSTRCMGTGSMFPSPCTLLDQPAVPKSGAHLGHGPQ